jgi:CTP:molybdopterin cytidylyltransferase MocA
LENSVGNFPLILLAGGKSSRMGIPKGLLLYQGRPWLLEQLHRFKAAGGKKVMVVLGYHSEEYKEIIWELAGCAHPSTSFPNLGISVVVNPQPHLGPFSSLQCALTALSKENYPGAFVLPIDVPGPAREVFQKMAQSFINNLDTIVPQFQNKGGHPVLLSRRFAELLAQIPANTKEARLDYQIRGIPRDKVIYLPVPDEKVCLNMNGPEDFRQYCERNE